jgi:enoyl-CoA hydratase/carnithine racemase
VTDEVQVSRPADGVALVLLNRPDRLNALSPAMVTATLRNVFDELSADESVRAVVLTGAGRAFCAGGDLDSDSFATSADGRVDYIRTAQRTILALRSMAIPTIAAVNGAAAGGGLSLALACDIRIAAPKASFSAPFAGMALVPDLGGCYLLPEIVGMELALELALSARRVGAEEALRRGLIGTIAENPVDDALALASAMAQAPRSTIVRTKELMRGSAERSFEDHVLNAEPVAQAELMDSGEFAERFAQYRAKIGS